MEKEDNEGTNPACESVFETHKVMRRLAMAIQRVFANDSIEVVADKLWITSEIFWGSLVKLLDRRGKSRGSYVTLDPSTRQHIALRTQGRCTRLYRRERGELGRAEKECWVRKWVSHRDLAYNQQLCAQCNARGGGRRVSGPR